MVDVTGTWSGRYEETSCTSASCQPCCSMRFKGGPWVRDFTLRLMQQDADVAGQFEELPLEHLATLSGGVSGIVSGHRLRLRGKLGAFFGTESQGFTELWDFDAAVGAPGTEAIGSFVLVDKRKDGSDFMQRECKIVRLDRE